MKFWSQTDGPGVGSPVFGGVAWTVTVDGGGVAWTGDGGGGAGAAADEVLSPLRGRTLADPCEASSNLHHDGNRRHRCPYRYQRTGVARHNAPRVNLLKTFRGRLARPTVAGRHHPSEPPRD